MRIRNITFYILFLFLLFLNVLPIWLFPYFPSQDGPSHLENANILNKLIFSNIPVFQEYYSINKVLLPNWLGHISLAIFLHIFPPLVSEKLLLAFYIITFPISLCYVLYAINPANAWIALLSFPLIYNYTFHMGFYNFSLSLPLFLLFIGYYIRHSLVFKMKTIVILMLLSLILYFSHIVSLGMAFITILYIDIYSLLFCEYQDSKHSTVRQGMMTLKRNLVQLLFIFLPTIILGLAFAGKQGLDINYRTNAIERVLGLFGHLSFTLTEAIPIILYDVLVSSLCVVVIIDMMRNRGSHKYKYFVLFATYVFLYLLVPDTVTTESGALLHRLYLFVHLAFLLWVASQQIIEKVKYCIIFSALFISIAQIGINTSSYAELNDYLSEYLSCRDVIRENTILLPLCFSPQGEDDHENTLSRNVKPFIHAASYLSVNRNVVVLANYEANSSIFPILYNPVLNPYTHIGDIEHLPSRIDLLNYNNSTGKMIDYVLVWNMKEDRLGPDAEYILEQLNIGYNLIYISKERQLMKLYARKGLNEH
jgi:hypothetical protein